MDQEKTNSKQVLRRILPESWLKERETFLRLGSKAGAIYAQLRILDLVRMRLWSKDVMNPSARSFLFVCFGNIMRSPMAAMLFQKCVSEANLQHIAVRSAGLHAIPGNEAHPRALTAAEELGLSLASHRARLLTPDLVSQSDAIFVMDFQNKAEVLALYPEAKEKVLMLSAYADGPARNREIPDPYFGDLDATRACYATLQTCIQNLVANLVAYSGRSVASISTSAR